MKGFVPFVCADDYVGQVHVHLHSVTCIGSSSLVQHIVHVECSLHIIRSSSVCQL